MSLITSYRLSMLFCGAALLVPMSSFAAGSAPQPGICVRSCWGARAPSGSISQMAALTRAIVHHTADGTFNTSGLEASKANMRSIQNYHMNTNGWSDIGYHFLVDKYGNIFEARSGSMSSLPRGAHDAANTNSFGFTLMGYFHPNVNNVPPAAMMNSLYNVIAWRMPSAWRPYGSPGGTYGNLGNTVGYVDAHRRVVATACPGDYVYNNFMGSNLSAGAIRNEINARVVPPAATEIVIDNSSAGFSVTGAWSTGSSSADKFGPDYRFHSTAAISEPAAWNFSVPTTRNWEIYAWWPQGSNRSTTAPYILPDNTSVPKNQQTSGGAWNSLGIRNLAAGSRIVKLSCWTTSGFIVVADAVKIVGR